MAGAPWSENQYKVVVEFCRGSQGASRVISLKHSPSVVPPQLHGRISPQDWAAFMVDVQALANTHPYVVKPGAGRMASWVGGACIGAVLGFCCINPDGGDWETWIPQTEQVIAKWRPAFAAGGCTAGLKRAQQSYWIQIDVNPNSPPAAHLMGAAPGKPGGPEYMAPPASYPAAAQQPYGGGPAQQPGYPGAAAAPGGYPAV